MNISDLYKAQQLQTTKVKFKECDIEILLFTEKEAKSMEGKDIDEQISMCIHEKGKSLLDLGQKENIKDNMPIAHKRELMELIMSANGVDVSFDELKKN